MARPVISTRRPACLSRPLVRCGVGAAVANKDAGTAHSSNVELGSRPSASIQDETPLFEPIPSRLDLHKARFKTSGSCRERGVSLRRWSAPGFEVVCEIQPPTRPDLMRVRHQIGVMSKVATAFLVPDNHLGRATVSSVGVAHEVDRMGGRSVACLNARDRNLLGLRRDLLTAAAYGVDEFLLVYGDRPTVGSRSGELTVRSMMAEVRHFSAFGEAGIRPKVAVTSRLTALPAWKAGADLLFLQASYRCDRLAAWRDGVDFAGKVYAGVLVPPKRSPGSQVVR